LHLNQTGSKVDWLKSDPRNITSVITIWAAQLTACIQLKEFSVPMPDSTVAGFSHSHADHWLFSASTPPVRDIVNSVGVNTAAARGDIDAAPPLPNLTITTPG